MDLKDKSQIKTNINTLNNNKSKQNKLRITNTEEQAFTTNFTKTGRIYFDLIRVTNITNTIESRHAFKSLMEQQEWQFGPFVRVDFVHDARVKRPREDTTIAFVQLKLTIMHYHLARQFQSYLLYALLTS